MPVVRCVRMVVFSSFFNDVTECFVRASIRCIWLLNLCRFARFFFVFNDFMVVVVVVVVVVVL